MSYHTDMRGYFEVPADETQAVVLLIETATVSPTSDNLFVEDYAYTTMGEGRMRINISNPELDYSDTKAKRFLSLFSEHNIQDGSEIYFDAEDGSTWRLTKKPEGWVEETGHVVYDDPRTFLQQQDEKHMVNDSSDITDTKMDEACGQDPFTNAQTSIKVDGYGYATDLYNLPVGTSFTVKNGCWDGTIVEDANAPSGKAVEVWATGAIIPIDPGNRFSLVLEGTDRDDIPYERD